MENRGADTETLLDKELQRLQKRRLDLIPFGGEWAICLVWPVWFFLPFL
jgi:hypothetical protein